LAGLKLNTHNLFINKIIAIEVTTYNLFVRSELQAGMGRDGQFSAQEIGLIFDLADTDGNGKLIKYF
jgi:hypothetical protein